MPEEAGSKLEAMDVPIACSLLPWIAFSLGPGSLTMTASRGGEQILLETFS